MEKKNSNIKINIIFIIIFSYLFYILTLGYIYNPGKINFYIFKKDYTLIVDNMLINFPEISSSLNYTISFKGNNVGNHSKKTCKYKYNNGNFSFQNEYPICDDKYNNFFKLLKKLKIYRIFEENSTDSHESLIIITPEAGLGSEKEYVYSKLYFKNQDNPKNRYILKINDNWGIHIYFIPIEY